MGRVDLDNLLNKARGAWMRSGDLFLAAACFVLALSLYLRTLAPSVVALFDDTLEFPLAVKRMAIAHPTGYPLYLLLGKAFSLLPWRDVAGRVNLLSAAAGALAAALAYLLARQMTRRRWTALLAAAALAVSPVFWSQAVVAEVYTLNAAFVAGLLLAAMRWGRQPLRESTPPASPPLRQGGGEEGEGEGTPPASPPLDSLRSPQVRQGGAKQAMLRLAERIGSLYRRALPEVPAGARLRVHPAIYGLAALLGLGLTHHRTVILTVPALLVFLLLTERRVLARGALLGAEHPEWPRWRRTLGKPSVLLLLSFFAPLLLYLYLPIRGGTGSLDGTYVNTWRGFWHQVLGSSYGAFLGENPLAREMSAADFAGLFWRQAGPVGLALAVVGAAGLVRRPKALALTGLAFLAFLLFGILYRAPDLEVFFIPAFLIVAVWAAVGLDHGLDLLRMRGRSLGVRRLLGVCGVALALAAVAQPAAIAVRAFPDVDLSQRWEAHDLAEYWLRPALAPEGSVVGLLGEMTLLRYFQETEGLAPGLTTIAADDPAARLAAVEAERARGKAVYVTRSLDGLAERYSLSAVAGAIDVRGEVEALVRAGEPVYDATSIPKPTALEPVPGLELLGYSLEEHSAHRQGWVTLRLWWRAARGMEQALKVSARLLDTQRVTAAAVDGEPVAWAYPMTAWRPGEIVADAYEIPWPAGAAPGTYAPLVIVYDVDSGQERGRAELPAVQLSGNPSLPPGRIEEAGVARAARARFGEVELLGFSAPGAEAVQGEAVSVTLLWQARRSVQDDLRLRLALEGQEAVLPVETEVGGAFPTGRWAEGQAVRQVVRVFLPAELPVGEYRLWLRVSRGDQPLPWGRGLLPGGSELELGRVTVGAR